MEIKKLFLNIHNKKKFSWLVKSEVTRKEFDFVYVF